MDFNEQECRIKGTILESYSHQQYLETYGRLRREADQLLDIAFEQKEKKDPEAAITFSKAWGVYRLIEDYSGMRLAFCNARSLSPRLELNERLMYGAKLARNNF